MENLDKIRNNSVAIVGWQDGAAGQIEHWLENSLGYHVACFINPSDEIVTVDPKSVKRDVSQFSYPSAESFKGRPLLHTSKWPEKLKELGIKKVLITTDNQKERYAQIQQAKSAGLELISAIHPTSLIMNEAILGKNIILYPNSYVGYRAELYDGVIVNVGAQIEHHNVIRECATIDPGAIFAGNVTVEKFARVHMGVKIINRKRVGEGAIVGAGAVIIEDVPANTTVVGVPGKVIKTHSQGDLNG